MTLSAGIEFDASTQFTTVNASTMKLPGVIDRSDATPVRVGARGVELEDGAVDDVNAISNPAGAA